MYHLILGHIFSSKIETTYLFIYLFVCSFIFVRFNSWMHFGNLERHVFVMDITGREGLYIWSFFGFAVRT